MNQRLRWGLVAGACALFLAQTVPLLSHRWVEDESWQCIPAYALLKEGRIRNPTFAGTDSEYKVCVKPPGHTFLLLPTFRWLGVGVWQARLPSILAGLGVVILTFLLGSELAGPNVGVLSAWLVATDNFLFLAARTARPEVFVAFCGLLAALPVLRSQDSRSAAAGLCSGLAVGAAMLFHPNGVAMAVGIAGLLLAQDGAAFWRDRRVWSFGMTVVAVAMGFLIWTHSTPAHAEAFASTYSRAEKVPLLTKLRQESLRYSDYLGISNLRLRVATRLPLRAHIAAVILAAFGVLAWKNHRALTVLLILAIPYLLWFVYEINKTSRYFAILAPIFAVAVAAAAAALVAHRKSRLIVIAACLLFGLSQLAGNAFLLYKSRSSSYGTVQRELRQLIPPGSSVYGAITFWMALHDYTYYSYDRMPFKYAIAQRRPEYLILNDRVMVRGMGWGLDDWAALRTEANEFARNRGRLVGFVRNPFYGELEIYRIDYTSSQMSALPN
jgi:4-amino-4-deoxy-L-arabinose transferase-like glycosyltransferase